MRPSRPAANKPESVGRAALRCSLCPACAPLAPGAALLGTARSWRGIVPSAHLAREGRMTVTIGRGELLVALGGAAAAWPVAARAQQQAMPVVGYLTNGAGLNANNVKAFRKGLSEMGFVEGRRNVAFDTQATDQYGQFPALALELADRKVAA